MNELGKFEIQVRLNKLATKYSQSVVRLCHINIRSTMQTAKKLKFLATDPAEDVNMPQTKPIEKPVMTQDQLPRLIERIQDLHDLCLIAWFPSWQRKLETTSSRSSCVLRFMVVRISLCRGMR